MSKRITIIIAALLVLGVAFFLLTATQKSLHKPDVMAQPVAP